MKRIDFLKTLGLGALALTFPIAAQAKEKIYYLSGTGIEDDTEAFQAWIDGKEVWWKHRMKRRNTSEDWKPIKVGNSIDRGRFRLTREITTKNIGRNISIKDCKFHIEHDGNGFNLHGSDKYMFEFIYNTVYFTRKDHGPVSSTVSFGNPARKVNPQIG